jgi:hypothetical protein
MVDTDARKQLGKGNNELAELAPLINILQRLTKAHVAQRSPSVAVAADR